jgi:hypothetical protein
VASFETPDSINIENIIKTMQEKKNNQNNQNNVYLEESESVDVVKNINMKPKKIGRPRKIKVTQH